MSTLANFPMLSQLTSITDTADAGVSNNKYFDCVPTALLAGVLWLLHRTAMDATYNPDAMKDAAYSPSYTGATAAAAYIPWCAAHGVTLAPLECDTLANTVAQAHTLLAEGVPVVFTQQDDYYEPASERSLYTHVCVFYADTPTTLTCLDPFLAAPLTYSDAVWETRLRSSVLWTLRKTPTMTTIQEEDSTMPVSPLTLAQVTGYYVQDGAMWKCTYAYNPATGAMEPSPNGAILGNAMLARYQTIGGEDLMGLTLLGLCITNEMRIGPVGTPETAQVFENGILVFDPQHQYDNRPGSTHPVYLTHLFTGVGLHILKNALARLLETQATAPTTTTAPDPQIAVLQAKIDALTKTLNAQPVAPLQAEIASLKATLAHIEQEAASASAV